MMMNLRTYLVYGDPFNRDGNDLIAQVALIDVEDPVPDGWRETAMTERRSEIIRIFRRYEID